VKEDYIFYIYYTWSQQTPKSFLQGQPGGHQTIDRPLLEKVSCSYDVSVAILVLRDECI